MYSSGVTTRGTLNRTIGHSNSQSGSEADVIEEKRRKATVTRGDRKGHSQDVSTNCWTFRMYSCACFVPSHRDTLPIDYANSIRCQIKCVFGGLVCAALGARTEVNLTI